MEKSRLRRNNTFPQNNPHHQRQNRRYYKPKGRKVYQRRQGGKQNRRRQPRNNFPRQQQPIQVPRSYPQSSLLLHTPFLNPVEGSALAPINFSTRYTNTFSTNILGDLITDYAVLLEILKSVEPSAAFDAKLRNLYERVHHSISPLLPSAELIVFGSVSMGVHTMNSDLDLCILDRSVHASSPHETLGFVHRAWTSPAVVTTRQGVKTIESFAGSSEVDGKSKTECDRENLPPSGDTTKPKVVAETSESSQTEVVPCPWSNVKFIATAKVPVIKIDDANGQVDIVYNCPSALAGAELIRAYVSRWPILIPLIRIVKCWVTRRRLPLPQHRGLSGFAWIIMVLQVLQRSLPLFHAASEEWRAISLDEMKTDPNSNLNGDENNGSGTNAHVVLSQKGDVKKSEQDRFSVRRGRVIFALLYRFFEHYGSSSVSVDSKIVDVHDKNRDVVCITSGGKRIDKKLWKIRQGKITGVFENNAFVNGEDFENGFGSVKTEQNETVNDQTDAQFVIENPLQPVFDLAARLLPQYHVQMAAEIARGLLCLQLQNEYGIRSLFEKRIDISIPLPPLPTKIRKDLESCNENSESLIRFTSRSDAGDEQESNRNDNSSQDTTKSHIPLTVEAGKIYASWHVGRICLTRLAEDFDEASKDKGTNKDQDKLCMINFGYINEKESKKNSVDESLAKRISVYFEGCGENRKGKTTIKPKAVNNLKTSWAKIASRQNKDVVKVDTMKCEDKNDEKGSNDFIWLSVENILLEVPVWGVQIDPVAILFCQSYMQRAKAATTAALEVIERTKRRRNLRFEFVRSLKSSGASFDSGENISSLKDSPVPMGAAMEGENNNVPPLTPAPSSETTAPITTGTKRKRSEAKLDSEEESNFSSSLTPFISRLSTEATNLGGHTGDRVEKKKTNKKSRKKKGKKNSSNTNTTQKSKKKQKKK
eukprot:g4995.t1